ncbi:MAG: UDP-N-acetylmuramoyl-L-alanyl-D-glutamate--2,6-diaminopimelate ligase [Clostridia bacterium]|nr:UDP-N-acetylmuramoyl-L-alanyl-D-glutamate--2,6-diaminopimelate ligase [Clostridia bacterium]
MYSLKELLDGAEYTCKREIDGIYVTGIKSNSRDVLPGNAFVCLKGCKKNGEDYTAEAIRRGAKVIICDKTCGKCDKNAVFVRVPSVRSVYAKMVSAMYGNPSRGLKIIAVTGTNGKTTVCQMIASAICESGKRCAFIGTLGAFFEGKRTSLDTMTTPDPEVLYALLKEYKDGGAEYVVMEASSHALSLGKLDGLTPEIAAITNLTAEHLDFHGNMDSYYEAKKILFERAKKGVFLCDDFYTVKMYDEASCEKVLCSVNGNEAKYRAENIGYSFENGTVFTLVKGESRLPLHSPIPAEFTVSNALLASAVLSELGFDDISIYRGLASLRLVKGRMERVASDGEISVFIDFAHTPDALSKLLNSVRRIRRSEQRIVTLFGCGGDRDRTKRSLMGAVASRLSDFVIITEDNSRSEEPSAIIDEIMLGFDKSCPHVRIENRKKAIEYAVMNAEKGDIILLCGKGHETYEIGKNGAVPFSERDIVTQALKMRKKGK